MPSNISSSSRVETLLIESQTAQLFTTHYPKENAESVILLHGGPGVPMAYESIIQRLVTKFQVITFDQRGTRRSPVKGKRIYSMEAYLKDIDAITKHFQIDKFHLFGHSWGGLYAQIYEEKKPEKLLSLFLCSPASGTGKVWKTTESEVMSFNKKRCGLVGFTMMGYHSLLGASGSNRAYQQLFKRVIENYHKDFNPNFKANDEMVTNVKAEPINKTRPCIVNYHELKEALAYDFPILISYGEKDIYGKSKEKVKRRFPKAKVIEFKNAGHLAWEHNPEAFFKALDEFYQI